MHDFTRLRRILEDMASLLIKHLTPQQEYVIEAIRAVESGDAASIATSLNGIGIWGGSGSVADLYLPETLRQRRDGTSSNVALRKLLGELLREMQELGIARPDVLLRHGPSLN